MSDMVDTVEKMTVLLAEKDIVAAAGRHLAATLELRPKESTA